MTYDLLISGGEIITSRGATVADIGIKAGRIAFIGRSTSYSAVETIDAHGLQVIPGLIDTQVHFREPGLEHKEDLASGTHAAITGGVTSILEMPNTNPNTISAEALQDKLDRANGRAWANYGFFVGASPENIDDLAQLEALPGTPGIKIFMGSSTGSLLVDRDEDLRRVLQNGRFRTPVHSEDESRNRAARAAYQGTDPQDHPVIRDAESARLSTERLLQLSHETGRPVHVLHVSTADEIPLLVEAKLSGLGTTAEVTPQHLFFSAPDCYDRLGTLAQMNPPMRSREHTEGLWKALTAGVFDVFGSDHAPHTREEKAKGYPASPSGMPGVQTMLHVLLRFVSEGRLNLASVVRMACEAPARLYRIQDRGQIAIGAIADLVILDAHKSFTFEQSMVNSKCGWSPYEGEVLNGVIDHVVIGGEIAVRGFDLVGSPKGRMLSFRQSVD